MSDEVRLRDGLRTCLLVFLGVRAALFVVSVVGVGMVSLPPDQPTGVPGWPAHTLSPGLGNLFTATERQDALWFLRIAADGYRETDLSAAFFPLYPLAVRVVAWLPGIGTLAAALLVSNAAFFGSLVVLHGLARQEPGVDPGRAVRYLALFPTAFFLMAPYSESLYLLLVLAAFWFARRDRWGLAALGGFGAGLTRSVAVVLPPALAVEAIRTRDRPTHVLLRLLAGTASLLGVGLYLAVWWRGMDALPAPLAAQSIWRSAASTPWASFARGIDHALRFGGWWLVDAAFVVGVLVVILAGARRLRPAYTVFVLSSLVLPLLAIFPSRPFLSMPRFCAVLFPVSLVLARQRLIPDALVTVVLGAGWVVLAVAFMNWQYIF